MQKTLSDVQYQTVICYYFNEMSVEEIATLFECSKGTVLSRLNYSRAKMKTAIEKYEEENNDKLHGVVFLPLFSSIFKEQSNHIEVPEINLDFTKQGIKNITSKGAESAVKTVSKGLVSSVAKTRVIAMLLGITVICGTSISTGVLAGCGKEDLPIATNASTTEVTTEPTEATDPTVSEEVKEAVKDNGLKVNDKGEVVDEKGNKVEVKDGKVEVKTDDGKTVTVKVDEVKEVTQPTKGSSSEPKETQKATTKATQPTTKKPATQTTTKKPATPTPTQKPTQKPTVKPTQPATQKPTAKPTQPATQKPTEKVWVVDVPASTEPIYEWVGYYVCNQCGARLDDANARKWHFLDSDTCISYHHEKEQVQTGVKEIPEQGHWEYK